MRNSMNDDDSFNCRFLKQTTRLPLPVDSYIDLEDSDEEEEELNLEMGCPYCSEGFDALGLCVHLEDQHPLEIKLGKEKKTEMNFEDLLNALTKNHGLCKRKLHDDDSFSIVSLLRKKLQEHSRSLQKESTSVTSSTNSATDPLLLSFVYNTPQSHESKVSQLDSSAEPSSSKILSKDLESGSDVPAGSYDRKDHEEKAEKSDFIQTILLSTIFADNL